MEKEELIKSMITAGVLKTPEIIKAFERVKREEFVLPEYKEFAYEDIPLPIIANQTISQPTTVAIMTEALKPKKGQKILEIGSGSGYQAAILAEIVDFVYTIERIKELVEFARKNLKKCGYKNVKVIWGNGIKGYEKEAPYDGIIVTAAASEIYESLKKQLKIGGRLVIPVGPTFNCKMLLLEKIAENKFKKEELGTFSFVPMLRGLE